MTNPSKAVKPIPDGYTSVTPWIISRNSAALIEFLEQAFQAQELARVYVGDGVIGHAEVRIGDAVVMMFDAKPEWPDSPAYLRLYVEDCDAAYQQALAAGAVSVTEPTSLFFGDRVGRVRDPFGNLWWIQTRLEDLTPEEMEQRAQDPDYMKAMTYVAGAEIVVKIS